MKQKPEGTECVRIPIPVIIIFLLVTSALGSGCLENLPVPGINGFSFPPVNQKGGNLSVYFFDVGQGDSTLVVFGNTTILVDAGEIDKGDVIVQDMRSLGISRIDLLVATHPHSDHIGGMEKVLGSFAVRQVVDAGMPHPSPLYKKFLDAIESRHIPYAVAHQGQTIDLDPALRILVLSPPEQRFSDDLNDNSVVLRISYGTVDLLLAGDAGKGGEDRMVATGYALDSEIFKVAHHGSPYSTGNAFLDRVRPEIAVIPVGAGNPYGHPSDATVSALMERGCTVYRTDRNGDVLVTSDGISYTVKTSLGNGDMLFLHTTGVPPIPVTVTTSRSPPTRHDVVISAARFNADGDDRQNLNGEYIRITNRGPDPVSLNGWVLTDSTGSHPYLFPAFILFPESSVSVFTGSGSTNDTALFMGQTQPVWSNSGDEAVLEDNRGDVVDRTSDGI